MGGGTVLLLRDGSVLRVPSFKWPNPLPYDSEVEWLESTGTQYINTGLVVTPTMRMDVDMMVTDWYANQYSLTGTSGIRFTFGKGYSGNAGNAAKLYFGLGAQNFPTSTALSGLANVRHTYSLDAATATAWLDGTTSWSLSGAGTISTGVRPILLLAQSTGTGASDVRGQQVAKLYGATFADNGTVVRRFIPVRVGSGANAVGCLYDQLGTGGMNPDGSARNDGLYFNRGSGAFVVGPDKP